MSFNSWQYLIFLVVTIVLYYLFRQKYRNYILLVASYFFYMCAVPKYALLLLFSTIISYIFARILEKEPGDKRKAWLVIGLILCMMPLFFLKYFDFFGECISSILVPLGFSVLPRLDILLPIGISFYTFTVTGYLIDVYRKKSAAEHDFICYSLFVSFFPSLLSGPIERFDNMMPQLKTKHTFTSDNIKTGILRFLWGLFKKMVIADQLAIIVNAVYGSPLEYSGLQTVLAVCAFSIQIYCDFSAYSDMAIGSASMLGFTLTENFDAPYLTTSVKGFWRRWHISLTSWFRDYLYFPLGGSRCSKVRSMFNVLIVFLVSGLWHGAGVTFVIWGLLNGIYQIAGDILAPVRKSIRSFMHISDKNIVLKAFQYVFTFILITVSWIFFRAESVDKAYMVIRQIFTGSEAISLAGIGLSLAELIEVCIFIAILGVIDALSKKYQLEKKVNDTVWLRYAVYLILIMIILIFGAYGPGYDPQDFVYFKF
ncbi:MAG: MBOAT family O-acyltransferase [Clostridia bacterium]